MQQIIKIFLSQGEINISWSIPSDSVVKNRSASAGDAGSITGLGGSLGGGNGNPLQNFCLEKPKNRGAWQAPVHGLTKSQTQLRSSVDEINIIIVTKVILKGVLPLLLKASRE